MDKYFAVIETDETGSETVVEKTLYQNQADNMREYFKNKRNEGKKYRVEELEYQLNDKVQIENIFFGVDGTIVGYQGDTYNIAVNENRGRFTGFMAFCHKNEIKPRM